MRAQGVSIFAIATLVVCNWSIAFAQSVINADFAQVQPQIYRDTEGIYGCGLRIVAASLTSTTTASMVDFSLNIWVDKQKGAWGLLKGGLKKGNPQLGAEKMTPEKVTKFYVSNVDGTHSAYPTKFINAEDANYKLGGTEAPPTLNLLMDIVNGQRVQVGMVTAKDSIHGIYSFTAQMSKDDKAAFEGCLKGYMTRLDALATDLETK